MRVTPRGVGSATGPGHQRHLGAGLARGTGDGKTHLAAGKVGDAAHRVDGLEGGAGGDQHLPAPPALGREEGGQCAPRRMLLGLQHAAVAGLAAGLVAVPTAQQRRAVGHHLRQLRCVAGWVHISRFIAGASSSGTGCSPAAGQAQQAEQVVGPALRQLGR
jgi:hypothetical protein